TASGAEYGGRILGTDYPDVLAADRIYDDYLYRRTSECVRRSSGSGSDRRSFRMEDALESEASHGDAVRYDLRLPDTDQLLQAVRPEPGSDRRRPKSHDRDAGHEHLSDLLCKGRSPVEGTWAGEGSDFLSSGHRDFPSAAEGDTFQGGAAVRWRKEKKSTIQSGRVC